MWNSLCLVLMIAFLYSCGNQHAPDKAKPNIIYILADDMGYGDLSVYGQKHFQTPNIDELANEGVRFLQHYAGNTVCAPSRSALLSGLHVGHTPIRGNKEVFPEGQYPFPDSLQTVAKLMQSAGYVTGAFGKWGLGYPGSEGVPNNLGFDQFFGYNCQRFAHVYYPPYLWKNSEKVYLPGNEEGKKQEYAPEVIHQEVLNFIEKNKENPFFLYVPTAIPHAELVAPDSVMKQFSGKYLPEHSFEGLDYGDPDFTYNKGPYGSQPEAHAAFVAMISILDRQVGEIVDKLDELGLTENTIVMFTSDNGPHEEGGADPDYFDSNGPLKGYKRDLYEGGIRVPFIVKWPGVVAQGTTSNHISAFWDIFPTFADIVDAEVDNATDGISFLPVLTGNPEAQREHQYLYWEFHEKGGRQAIRLGKWKGVKYNVFSDTSNIELYDLSIDLGETNNVADQYPEVVDSMKQILDTVRTASPVFTFSSATYSGN